MTLYNKNKNIIPNLMNEYLSYEKILPGFTLAYASFFKQFDLCKEKRHLTWNSKVIIFDNISLITSIDFIKEQQRWIASPEIQDLYLKNPYELQSECQRRINFFVNYLHEKGGPQGHDGGGWNGKLSPIFADLRNIAYHCLK